jgi:Tfp pilus assembly protein PilF
MAKNQPDQAVDAFTKVLSLQPKRLDAQLALSRLHLGRGDGKQAVSFARQVLAAQPANLNARVLLVRGDVLSGTLDIAEQDLAPLQKNYPTSPTVADLTAIIQLARKQPEAARASYERALKVAPRDFEGLAGLIRLDLQAGRAADAVARIDRYLEGGKPDFNGLVLASRTYLAGGKPEKAEKLLQSAIEADPRKLETYSLLGQLYAKQNRIDDATRVYSDLVGRDTKSASAHTMLGLLYEHQGKVDDAEKAYKAALAVEPRTAVAANNLAMIQVSRNQNLEDARQLAEPERQRHARLDLLQARTWIGGRPVPRAQREDRAERRDVQVPPRRRVLCGRRLGQGAAAADRSVEAEVGLRRRRRRAGDACQDWIGLAS